MAWTGRGVYVAGGVALRTGPGLAARGAALTAARVAGGVGLAVAVPVAVGFGVSHLIAGKQGRMDYVDFMTGGVSPGAWWNAITLKSMR